MATGSRRGGGLTTAEMRLAEQYVSVLDYVSRCALGIDRGDWFYLYDKAGTLAAEAERLAELAHEAYDAPRRPRVAAVRAAVAWFGGHYRAARLLHPPHSQGVGSGEAALARHPAEITAALPQLRAVFEVADESRPYPDRPPSRLVRVYLDIRPPAAPSARRDAPADAD